jgi:hypothetical protein
VKRDAQTARDSMGIQELHAVAYPSGCIRLPKKSMMSDPNSVPNATPDADEEVPTTPSAEPLEDNPGTNPE